MSEHPATPEVLLNDLGWLRGLARSLVRDEERAEDLVQETLVVALETPPRNPGAWRAWLRQVARNLVYRNHRTEVRRERREHAVARDGSVESSIEASLERAELHRSLVDAVLSLGEPYRSTVVLRYFDGLEPMQIGERLGVPSGTVRVRLKRAHDQLREKLDAAHGDDRRAWLVPLLEIARGPGTTSMTVTTTGAAVGGFLTTLGGWIMAQKAVAAVVAIAVLIGGMWWATSEGTTPGESRSASDAVSDANRGSEGGGTTGEDARAGVRERASDEAGLGAIEAPVVGVVVVDQKGEPRAGVRLMAGSGRAARLATSDEAGRATWGDEVEFPVEISVSDAKYLALEAPFEIARRGNARLDHRVVVALGARVSGRVVDGTTGLPVPMAFVSLMDAAPPRQAVADLLGRFELTGISAGSHELLVVRSRYSNTDDVQRVGVHVELGQSIDDLEIELDGGVRVTGRVLRGDVPVADAIVTAHAAVHSPPTGKTDADGMFEFVISSRAAKLGAAIEVDGIRWVSAREDVVVVDAAAEPVTLHLVEASALSGRVVDVRGEPVPQQTISIAGPGGATYQTKSDDEGRFEFVGLVPGRYVLPERQVECPSGKRVEGVVWTLAGVEAREDIVGRVIDEAGQPISGASVSAHGTYGWRETTSDSEGEFRIRGLPLRSVQLSASATGFSRRSIEIEAAEFHEITLVPTSTITGRVVDRRTGAPISNFELGAVSQGELDLARIPLGVLRRQVTPSGEFTLTDVGAPLAFVLVRVEGYAMGIQRVDTSTPGEFEIEVALEPIPDFDGVVVDRRGEPVPGASIHAARGPSVYEEQDRSLATTDGDGRFQVEVLVERSGRLVATHPDFAPGHAEYAMDQLAGRTLRIELPDLGHVTGRITEGGVGLPGASVQIADEQGYTVEETDADGHYEIARAEGRALIRVSRPGETAPAAFANIEVKEGEVTRQDFELERGVTRVTGRVHRGSTAPTRAKLMLLRADAASAVGAISAEADASGRFEFDSVSDGTYQLVLEALFGENDLVTRARTIEIAGRDPAPIDWDLAAGQPIVLEVAGLESGEEGVAILFRGEVEIPSPLTQAALLEHLSKVASQIRVPGNGEARFAATEPGDYTVLVIWGAADRIARGPDGLPSRAASVEVGAEAPARLELRLTEE